MAAAAVLLTLGALWPAPARVGGAADRPGADGPPSRVRLDVRPTAHATEPGRGAHGSGRPPGELAPDTQQHAALQPMEAARAPSAEGPPEPRAIHPGLVTTRGPLRGQSRWELKIKTALEGQEGKVELFTHSQTEGACAKALDELREQRGARWDGAKLVRWKRAPVGFGRYESSAWCELVENK